MRERATYLGLFDGPNADNLAAMLALCNAYPNDEVVFAVSATAAHPNPNASPSEIDYDLSRRYQEGHAARAAGMLGRAGVTKCVYVGLHPSETGIVPIVPYRVHTPHEGYDVHNDATGQGKAMLAGHFDDLLARLQRAPGPIRVVVGGPFSELPPLINDSEIVHKLGTLAAQAGFVPNDRLIHAKMSFNGDVDLQASLRTYLQYPGDIYLVPSTITRSKDVTFADHQELIDLGIHPELSGIYAAHRALTAERHYREQARRAASGEGALRERPPLSIHDLQAVLALRYAMGLENPELYTLQAVDTPVTIAHILNTAAEYADDGFPLAVPADLPQTLGYADGNLVNGTLITPRYQVVAQNAALYKQRVPQLLATPSAHS